jgi:hypothetical protein
MMKLQQHLHATEDLHASILWFLQILLDIEDGLHRCPAKEEESDI